MIAFDFIQCFILSFIYWTSFQTFVLFEFFSNVWVFCTSCGQWKSIQFLRVTVRTAKYDSYLIQLMLVSILGTRFKKFNFSPSMSERLGGQVVRRRSRKATWWLPMSFHLIKLEKIPQIIISSVYVGLINEFDWFGL